MVMLHIELMKQGSRETLWWRLDEEKDDSLLDPEPLLLDIVPKVGVFNLSDYDGDSFVIQPPKEKTQSGGLIGVEIHKFSTIENL